MSKIILQVPITKELKAKAEQASANQGFSSLQESVRVFLSELSEGNLKVSFEPVIKLSAKAEGRYEKMLTDFESKKNVRSVGNVSDLISKLNEN